MSQQQKIVGIIIAMIIVIGLFWLLQYNDSGNTDSDEPIKIGWIGPQTGDAAVLGMDSATAAQLAVDEINSQGGADGRQLQLFMEDDQYNTAKAISAYEKLVKVNGVKILLMQTYGAVFALAERAKQDGVTLIDTLDCNSQVADLGDHVFCVGVESESIARLLSTHAEQQGFDVVGVLHFNSDNFMPYVKDVFAKEFSGRTVAEGYQAGTTDFRTTLSKFRSENIDALVFLGYDELGNAMKQARTLGIRVPFLAPGTITSPGWQKAAQGTADGTTLTFWQAPRDREASKKFVAAFKAKANREPIVDLFTYPAYDAVKAIAQALESNNNLNVSLLDVKNLEGATGAITFAKDGSVRIPFVLYNLVDGVPQRLSQ